MVTVLKMYDSQLSHWWKLASVFIEIRSVIVWFLIRTNQNTELSEPSQNGLLSSDRDAHGSEVLVEPADPISSSVCNISADLCKISAYQCRYVEISSIISIHLSALWLFTPSQRLLTDGSMLLRQILHHTHKPVSGDYKPAAAGSARPARLHWGEQLNIYSH